MYIFESWFDPAFGFWLSAFRNWWNKKLFHSCFKRDKDRRYILYLFNQTAFSFSTAHSPQQLSHSSQPTAAFFHSHSSTKHTLRLAYVAKGSTRPIGHDYPRDHFDRIFCETWYTKHPWLEYSMEKDAAYCFYCFLFRQDPVDENFGYTTFTKEGYSTCKNAYKAFPLHVGGARSIHNQAKTAYEDFKNQSSSLKHKVTSTTKEG